MQEEGIQDFIDKNKSIYLFFKIMTLNNLEEF